MWLSPEEWTALGTVIIAGATAGLAVMAWFQIQAARDENRRTQTLLACGSYETNETIHAALKALVVAKGVNYATGIENLKAQARELRLEILTVLNFLDAIAIGIDQKLYVDDLAKEHLQGIMATHVSELIDSGVLEIIGVSRDNFSHLLATHNRWKSG